MIGDIFQPTHLIFIFVVALLVLGPKRLPEVGRSLGKGIRDFRGAMAGIEDQAHGVFNPDDTSASAAEPTPSAEIAAPAPAGPPTDAGTPTFDEPSTPPTFDEPPTPAEPPTVTANAPTVNPVVSVAATRSGAGSGSGSAEPHPDEYAD